MGKTDTLVHLLVRHGYRNRVRLYPRDYESAKVRASLLKGEEWELDMASSPVLGGLVGP
jgi:hypothetical protein